MLFRMVHFCFLLTLMTKTRNKSNTKQTLNYCQNVEILREKSKVLLEALELDWGKWGQRQNRRNHSSVVTPDLTQKLFNWCRTLWIGPLFGLTEQVGQGAHKEPHRLHEIFFISYVVTWYNHDKCADSNRRSENLGMFVLYPILSSHKWFMIRRNGFQLLLKIFSRLEHLLRWLNQSSIHLNKAKMTKRSHDQLFAFW